MSDLETCKELPIAILERGSGYTIAVALRTGLTRGQRWTAIRLRLCRDGRRLLYFDLRPRDVSTLASLVPASISDLLVRFGDELDQCPEIPALDPTREDSLG